MSANQVKYIDPLNKCLEALLPKPGALLALAGSYCVIREVVSDLIGDGKKSRKALPVSRVILSMSICDFFCAFSLFLSTWPTPSQVKNVWGNIETQEFCTCQGFFGQFGLTGSMLWSLTLAVFYLLIVRYNWKDRQLEKLERWLHGGIWTITLGLAIAPIPLEMYNHSGPACWIESSPYGCLDSLTYGKDANCVRGDNAWVFQLVVYCFSVWVCIILVSVILFMVYCVVRKLEDRSLPYASTLSLQPSRDNSLSIPAGVQPTDHTTPISTDSENAVVNRKKSKAVATQGMFYMIALIVPYTMTTAYKIINGPPVLLSAVGYVAYLTLPLQGFFNFLVFARNRPDEMKTFEGRWLRWIFFRSFCCCCCRRHGGRCCSRRKGSVSFDEELDDSAAAAAAGIRDSSIEFQRASQAITLSDHDVEAENAKLEKGIAGENECEEEEEDDSSVHNVR